MVITVRYEHTTVATACTVPSAEQQFTIRWFNAVKELTASEPANTRSSDPPAANHLFPTAKGRRIFAKG